ncbi:MAG: heparinase II/III family protein [Candidatus Cloacimonetes bacterium]|nr:heparinase II/III family protein [Candidatus Cloacimonadota bacterium]
MRKVCLIYLIGLLIILVSLFGPLVYREFPKKKFSIIYYDYKKLPNFDFHVQKEKDIIIRNANAALKNIYYVGTPSVNFPPIKEKLETIWHNRNIASSNSHELYIHSLFIVWDLYYAYQFTSNEEYIEKGKDIISSWISNNNRWRPTKNPYIWNDHSTSERTILILYFWDYIKNKNFSDSRFDKSIENYCNQAAKYLANPQNYIYFHNHGIFEDIALLLISYHILDDKKAAFYENLSKKRFMEQIEYAFSDNSIHLENSPGYHFVVTDLAQFYLDLAGEKTELTNSLKNIIIAAQKMKALLLMPDGTLPPIGDTNPDDKIEGTNLLSDLMIADSLAGCFIVSTSDQYLLARSTGISKVHSHDDPLSFVYYNEGALIIDDTGFLNYKGNTEQRYTKSYLAHNGVFPSLENPNFDKQAFIRKIGIKESIYACNLEMQTQYGTIQRTFVVDGIKNRLEVIDLPFNTERDRWVSTFLLNNQLNSIDQIDSLNIKVTFNDEIYLISSNNSMQLVSAKSKPKIGWRARTLDKLYPATTIVKEIYNNETSRLTIQNYKNMLSNDSLDSVVNNINLENYQRADSIHQRSKILWGTQYHRRIYLFTILLVLLLVSFLFSFLLYNLKLLKRYTLIFSISANFIAILAVLYVVVRHVN